MCFEAMKNPDHDSQTPAKCAHTHTHTALVLCGIILRMDLATRVFRSLNIEQSTGSKSLPFCTIFLYYI